MERTAHFQLTIQKTAILLLLFPMIFAFFVFLAKISFFSIKLEKIVFCLMIVTFLSSICLSYFYTRSTLITLFLFVIISIIDAFNTPYLFAKIFNLVNNRTKLRSICELFFVWFGSGLFYLGSFILLGAEITFIFVSLSIALGIIIQYNYQIKPKNFTQIQLLPLNYRSIANGNVIGIDAVLIGTPDEFHFENMKNCLDAGFDAL